MPFEKFYFYTENVCYININTKYKSFLNIYSFCKKKNFLIIKNIFVKTSL